MISKIYFVLACLALLGCSSPSPQPIVSSLPVIDIDKARDYPVKRIEIREVADVEYIPLETTKKSLVATYVIQGYHVSDKYIVLFQDGRDILLFDRSGKYLWTVNRRGGGPEEYHRISSLAVDFAAEEHYVFSYNNQKIFVYSFKGDFKRLLRLPSKRMYRFEYLFDYNDKYLIGYNADSFHEKRDQDLHPYYFIHKKSGQLVPVDPRLTMTDRGRRVFHREIVTLPGIAYMDADSYILLPVLNNGSEFLITDIGLDTLYNLADDKLSPIAVRSPSVTMGEPQMNIGPILYTDSYLYFRLVSMKYDRATFRQVAEWEMPCFSLNRHTGEIVRPSIYDSNIIESETRGIYLPSNMNQTFVESNYGMWTYSASNLIRWNENGGLRGELKEIASKLKEDDNNVLVLYKYK